MAEIETDFGGLERHSMHVLGEVMPRQRRGLAARRAGLGYTQERFAETVGVERSTVWRWEKGTAAPLPEQRPRIVSVLGVTPEELDDLLNEIAAKDTSSPQSHVPEHPGATSTSSWDDPDELWLQLQELQESNVGDEQLRFLEDQVPRIVAEYEHRGPVELGLRRHRPPSLGHAAAPLLTAPPPAKIITRSPDRAITNQAMSPTWNNPPLAVTLSKPSAQDRRPRDPFPAHTVPTPPRETWPL